MNGLRFWICWKVLLLVLWPMFSGVVFANQHSLLDDERLEPEDVDDYIFYSMEQIALSYAKISGVHKKIIGGSSDEEGGRWIITIILEGGDSFSAELPECDPSCPETATASLILINSNKEYWGELSYEYIETDDGYNTDHYYGFLEDSDSDSISLDVLLGTALDAAGDTKIDVLNDRFVINGSLGFLTYVSLKAAIQNNPQIKLLELQNVPGSLDDRINLYTSQLVRNANISTYISRTAEIASGGVDLFAAGVQRIAEAGAYVGVHSWCCTSDGQEGRDLPLNDLAHVPYLIYFKEMLGPKNGPEFYFFTLKAGDFNNVMPMTTKQMRKFSLATQIIY